MSEHELPKQMPLEEQLVKTGYPGAPVSPVTWLIAHSSTPVLEDCLDRTDRFQIVLAEGVNDPAQHNFETYLAHNRSALGLDAILPLVEADPAEKLAAANASHIIMLNGISMARAVRLKQDELGSSATFLSRAFLTTGITEIALAWGMHQGREAATSTPANEFLPLESAETDLGIAGMLGVIIGTGIYVLKDRIARRKARKRLQKLSNNGTSAA